MAAIPDPTRPGVYPAPGTGMLPRRLLFGRGWVFIPVMIAGLVVVAMCVMGMLMAWRGVFVEALAEHLPYASGEAYALSALGALTLALLASLPPKQILVRPARNEVACFRGLVWRPGRWRQTFALDAVESVLVDRVLLYTTTRRGGSCKVYQHRVLLRLAGVTQAQVLARFDYLHSAGRVGRQLWEALDRPLRVYSAAEGPADADSSAPQGPSIGTRLEEQRRERAARLEEAKAEAVERGKEPFDIEALAKIYHFSHAHMAKNYRDYAGELEAQYYVTCRDLMSLLEFAEFRRLNDVYDGGS